MSAKTAGGKPTANRPPRAFSAEPLPRPEEPASPALRAMPASKRQDAAEDVKQSVHPQTGAAGPHVKDDTQPAEDLADYDLAAEGQQKFDNLTSVYRGMRWGAIFMSALGGLVSLAMGLWLTSFLDRLFTAQGILGWIALALFAILVLAAVVIIMREILTLSRLSQLADIREQGESAIRHEDSVAAQQVCKSLKNLLGNRKSLAWTIAEMRDLEADIMSAQERLSLAERALIVPLDTEARQLIASTAQRVSVVTAISPMGILDVLYVGSENLRLMRKIALIYGGRPGTWGLIRLARMVLTNLVVAGAMSLGEDVIQQLLGHRLGAKLSARLGEGILNGALTARVGLATISTIRPLPFIEAKPAKLRSFLNELAKGWTQKLTGKTEAAS